MANDQHVSPKSHRRFLRSKRLFDLMLIVAALPVIVPVTLVVAAFVRLKMGTPVLFRQMRPGRHGIPFIMYKFRSMVADRDRHGALLADGARLTPFGRWLRATSLDELPELYNVFRGEMALVGPRPLLMQYLPLYDAQQWRRHEMSPGVTGWAQINGRNAISWEDKFALDVWYIDHASLWLDVRIIWLTLLKVVRRDGISAEGDATMPVFAGNAVAADISDVPE